MTRRRNRTAPSDRRQATEQERRAWVAALDEVQRVPWGSRTAAMGSLLRAIQAEYPRLRVSASSLFRWRRAALRRGDSGLQRGAISEPRRVWGRVRYARDPADEIRLRLLTDLGLAACERDRDGVPRWRLRRPAGLHRGRVEIADVCRWVRDGVVSPVAGADDALKTTHGARRRKRG